MPMMDLTLPAGALDRDAKNALVDELTTVLLRAERAPNTQFFRDVTWTFVHELEATDIYAAGRPIDRPLVHLMVTTPEGGLSNSRRRELVAEASRVLSGALGIPEEDGLRVWVTCREIAEGSWGAGGEVVPFSRLREIAAAERAQAQPA